MLRILSDRCQKTRRHGLVVLLCGWLVCACAPSEPEHQTREFVVETCADLLFSGAVSVDLSTKGAITGASVGGQAAGQLTLKGRADQLDAIELDTVPTFALTVTSSSTGAASLAASEQALSHSEQTVLAATLTCPLAQQIDRIRTLGATQLVIAPGAAPAQLFAYGTSQVNLAGFADNLEIRISGDAQVWLRQVEADVLDISLSGRGRVHAQGEANELLVQALGRGHLQGYALQVQTARVKARGNSVIEIAPSAHLQVYAEPEARVTYEGNPEISAENSAANAVQRQ